MTSWPEAESNMAVIHLWPSAGTDWQAHFVQRKIHWRFMHLDAIAEHSFLLLDSFLGMAALTIASSTASYACSKSIITAVWTVCWACWIAAAIRIAKTVVRSRRLILESRGEKKVACNHRSHQTWRPNVETEAAHPELSGIQYEKDLSTDQWFKCKTLITPAELAAKRLEPLFDQQTVLTNCRPSNSASKRLDSMANGWDVRGKGSRW